MNMQVAMEMDKLENTDDARELEAALLVRAALMLKECQDEWGADGHEARLDEALKFNQRLWTVFQSELSSDENPLPVDIRRNLLNLSCFVDKRTFETLANPMSGNLNVLIDINRHIAEGLAGQH
ncbi:MAG TPA: flagellar biosynthesis regulator FlaF [Thiobacillaceae bacterium]|nr:flagellar biosynthesis regulator FlaF [Thiobacillaceae bacterium]HNA82268.1 flagellar biosynthesis regulator FlaF [Thiobacillaceae bacterium]HNF88419.1 flagellar biosynthesis regulator FlaF [Thiobacillaceae bacterium]HNI06951.1 flagellar biosynthesis regulator FlaF [Thiobacillaceae bacterium]